MKTYLPQVLTLLVCLLYAAFSISGCAQTPPKQNDMEAGLTSSVTVHHDDEHAVTCWIYNWYGNAGGISCLPDAQIGGSHDD